MCSWSVPGKLLPIRPWHQIDCAMGASGYFRSGFVAGTPA